MAPEAVRTVTIWLLLSRGLRTQLKSWSLSLQLVPLLICHWLSHLRYVGQFAHRPNPSYLNQMFAWANLPESAASIVTFNLTRLKSVISWWTSVNVCVFGIPSFSVRGQIWDRGRGRCKVIQALSGASYIGDLRLPDMYLIYMPFILFQRPFGPRSSLFSMNLLQT